MKARLMLPLLLIVLLVLSGCFPYQAKTQTKGANIEPIPSASDAKATLLKLYFPANNGSLLMETRVVTENGDPVKQVIDELLKGPNEPYESPSVPQGTTLISYELKQNTIYINMSSEYAKASKLQIRSLVTSLTELPNINSVQILVKGEKLASLGMSPLTRQVVTGQLKYDSRWLKNIQKAVNSGKDVWRLDLLDVLRTEGGIVGFNSNDDFKLNSKDRGVAKVEAIDNGKSYNVELVQPIGTSKAAGIWVIANVSQGCSNIVEANPAQGETFIYGKLLSIDTKNRIIKIQREYQDSNDVKNKVDPNIKVLDNAVIHYQRMVGTDGSGIKYAEENMDFKDIKLGSELGIILTKDKTARAIIVSDPSTVLIGKGKSGNIKITKPMVKEVLTSPFNVVGFARVLKGVVNIQLISQDGNVLDQTTAQASNMAPAWGSFKAIVSYDPLDKPIDAVLKVYSQSTKGDQTNDFVTIPVRLK